MPLMDEYVVLTLDRLLGRDGTEKLIEVLTDHAIAHQQDGVATDARSFVRSKVVVQIDLATDARSGHITAEVAVRGGLTKLKGLIRPMRLSQGALLIEGEEDEGQFQLPGIDDPGRAGREEMASERRRERTLDLPGRRRDPIGEDPDGAPPEQDEPRLRSIG